MSKKNQFGSKPNKSAPLKQSIDSKKKYNSDPFLGDISAEDMARAAMKPQIEQYESETRNRSGTLIDGKPIEYTNLADADREMKAAKERSAPGLSSEEKGYGSMPSSFASGEVKKEALDQKKEAMSDIDRMYADLGIDDPDPKDMPKQEIPKKEDIQYSNLREEIKKNAARTDKMAKGASERIKNKLQTSGAKVATATPEKQKVGEGAKVEPPKKKNIVRRATHKVVKRTRAATASSIPSKNAIAKTFDKRRHTAATVDDAKKAVEKKNFGARVVDRIKNLFKRRPAQNRSDNVQVSGPNGFKKVAGAVGSGAVQDEPQAVKASVLKKDNPVRTEKYTRPAPRPPEKQNVNRAKMSTQRIEQAKKQDAHRIADQMKKRMASKTVGSGTLGPSSTPVNPTKPRPDKGAGRG